MGHILHPDVNLYLGYIKLYRHDYFNRAKFQCCTNNAKGTWQYVAAYFPGSLNAALWTRLPKDIVTDALPELYQHNQTVYSSMGVPPSSSTANRVDSIALLPPMGNRAFQVNCIPLRNSNRLLGLRYRRSS